MTNLLIVHPNFPGQFKLLSRELASRPDWKVVAIGEGDRKPETHPGISYHFYNSPTGTAQFAFPPLQNLDDHVRRGRSVAGLMRSLKEKGFYPDIVLGHPGWGDLMFLEEIFPRARSIAYLEFFYRTTGSDIDFDREFPPPRSDPFLVPLRNMTNLMAFSTASVGITPTRWQASLFPAPLRERMQILHEGIDTAAAFPDSGAVLRLDDGRTLTRAEEIVTYVARSLEPYRGFHIFMRALPELLRRRPNAHILIAGKEAVSYGREPLESPSWKAALLKEVGADIDLSRIHFLGSLSYERYLALLRISTAHVYLTYPFVLSWSLLEAMACGCAIAGSRTGPVLEVLEDRFNARLGDFFDGRALVDNLCTLIEDRSQRERLGRNARRTVVDLYDFRTRSLPQSVRLLKGL